MVALYLTVIGVLLAGLGTLTGALWKAKEEARGWKTSYEREKERADRQDKIVADAALATDIANKVAGALTSIALRPGGK
jgi:hypothetical protein